MTAFFCSTLGCHETVDGEKRPIPLWNLNGFADLLRSRLGGGVHCALIASDPDAWQLNDMYAAIDSRALQMSGVDIARCTVVDGRWSGDLDGLLARCGLLILCGGHVPAQNRFFKQLGLKERLESFAGVLVGVSAGSMNACTDVYAQPELEGEALDVNFSRWLEGLGLLQVSMVPHWQDVREESLDGLRLLEDISLPDSCMHPFYALEDGAFILCEGGHARLYGRAYYLSGGEISPVCDHGETLQLY